MATTASSSVISGMNLSNIRSPSTSAVSTDSTLTLLKQYKTAAYNQRNKLQSLNDEIKDLQSQIADIQRLEKRARLGSGMGKTTVENTVSEYTSAVSQALTLGTTDRQTTLRSTEAVNTGSVSYTAAPAWTGGSSAAVTVGGTFSGTGNQSFTFEAVNNRTVGAPPALSLDVYDEDGNYLERLTWTGGAPAGTEVTSTATGLTIAFDAGNLVAGDTFTVDVTADTPDETRPFDGTAGDDPGLQSGFSVTAGSFTVNGELITVDASDSIQSVLAKINASNAGVTAAYDSGTEEVLLTADEYGDGDIALAGDTSGFLAAMKLDGAVADLGEVDEAAAALGDVDDFAGVSAGSFEIDGVVINVDPTADSLNDILSRINAAGVGVSATYDSNTGEVTLSGAGFTLDDDTSGLLAALNIDESAVTTTTTTTSGKGSRLAARKLSDAIAKLQDSLNRIFTADPDDDDVRLQRISAQSKIRAALSLSFDESDYDIANNGFGLSFDLEAEEGDAIMDMSLRDKRRLQEAMREDPREMTWFLFGSHKREGLVDNLAEALGAARADLESEMEGLGSAYSAYI